jgi:hypothetical protein
MNDTADLDRRLDEALRRMEAPQAPRTLLPRVMAATRLSARVPWYRSEWRRWPLGWQLASGVATAAILALALDPSPRPGPTTWMLENAGALDSAGWMARQVEVAVAAGEALWLGVGEPIVPVVVALAMLMGVQCVLLGFTFDYVVLGRTFKR